MNWKPTVILAALLVVVTAVYLLSGSTPKPVDPSRDPVVTGMRADQVVKIEITRKAGSPLVLKRAKDDVGDYWEMVQQGSHAADSNLVQQIAYSLDRLVKEGAMDPGAPETAPQITGLEAPRVTVTFHSQDKTEVLRFGKSPPTNTTIVFCQRDGDPKVYRVGVETFDAVNKPFDLYRSKALVRYAAFKVSAVELETKFMVKRGNRPAAVEYERSVLQRFEQGAERGWYLTQPHREKMDDLKVQGLITELSNFEAAEYQPAGGPKAQGLDEPEVRLMIRLRNVEKPVAIHFGGEADGKRRRWVHVPGTGEVALIDMKKYEALLLKRSELRMDILFPFSREQVKTFEVEAKDLGKVLIERRETRKPDEPVPTVSWEVLHPQGLRIDRERVEAFVANILSNRITSFLGDQDFKLAGLDPAPVQLRVETKEGSHHVYHLARPENQAAFGWLRKEGINEIFEVRPRLVEDLRRLELNFLHMEMFNVPRLALQEFTFSGRDFQRFQPVYYSMKYDPKTGKWSFTDPIYKDQTPDADRVNGLLAVMNYLKAETLIARDPKTVSEYKLNNDRAPGVLKIVHAEGTAEVYISDDLNNNPGRAMYYARLSDSQTVFQINAYFVDSLRKPPVKKREE